MFTMNSKQRHNEKKLPKAGEIEPPEIPLTVEQELHSVIERIEDRILHHCDRPEIEMKILRFLEPNNRWYSARDGNKC